MIKPKIKLLAYSGYWYASDEFTFRHYSDYDVEFDYEEIALSVIAPDNNDTIIDSQGETVDINRSLFQQKVFKLNIREYTGLTRAKIDSLFESATEVLITGGVYKNIIKFCVWKIVREQEDGTDETLFWGLLSRNRKRVYSLGEETASQINELIFYEYNPDIRMIESGAVDAGYLDISYTIKMTDFNEEVIYLDSINDIKGMSTIKKGVNFTPHEFTALSLQELQVEFFNSNNNFSLLGDKQNSMFSFNIVKLYADATTTTAKLDLTNSNPAYIFKAGNSVRFVNDSGDVKDVYIISISTHATDKVQLNFASDIGMTVFKTGDLVSNNLILDKQVDITINTEGAIESFQRSERSSILQYKGLIKKMFKSKTGTAVLVLENILSGYFNKIISIYDSSYEPTKKIDSDGNLTSTLNNWTTQTGSGSLADVTVYSGANIGSWTLTFTSLTNYTVTFQSGATKAGSTSTDFYDETDSSDSTIKIASSDWSGTPVTGDVLVFYVSVNFNNKTIAQILYELIYNYAGVSIDLIDIYGTDITVSSDHYSFNRIHDLLSSETYNFSITDNLLISEIVEMFVRHLPGFLFQMNSGAIALGLLRLGDHERGTSNFNSLLDNSDNRYNEKLTITNKFNIKYGYDPETLDYLYSMQYPETDEENLSKTLYSEERAVSINLPVCYSKASALIIAKRLYEFFGFNLRAITLDCIPERGFDFELFTKKSSVDYLSNDMTLFKMSMQMTNNKILCKYTYIEDNPLLGAW